MIKQLEKSDDQDFASNEPTATYEGDISATVILSLGVTVVLLRRTVFSLWAIWLHRGFVAKEALTRPRKRAASF